MEVIFNLKIFNNYNVVNCLFYFFVGTKYYFSKINNYIFDCEFKKTIYIYISYLLLNAQWNLTTAIIAK